MLVFAAAGLGKRLDARSSWPGGGLLDDAVSIPLIGSGELPGLSYLAG